MKSDTTPKPYRLPSRTVTQLRELVDGGYTTTETAAVVNVVKPNMVGIGQTGNVVQLDNGKYVTVTEPGMIVEA